ncbi:glycosyltransferase [Microbacterium flavum]|uniref:glycosyltransferase n=1 Tax=Microbacterium flavum TaxID=415216 RepID=UPI0024ADEB5A|nr:glycosyltransferase [Microbacterium flavum]
MLSRFKKSTPAPPAPVPSPAGSRSDDAGAAAALLDSGIFDHSFYGEVMSQEDRTPRELAAHYVAHGLEAGYAPHPLIEISFLPPAVRDARRQPDAVTDVLEYLRTDEARAHAWGPLFDPRVLAEDPVDALAGLHPHEKLPVPADFSGAAPTLSQARDALLRFEATFRDQRAARLAWRRRRWDREATQQWVSRMPSPATRGDSLVSAIMVVSTSEESVGEAIVSFLAQTYARFELIVVDVTSADHTREIIDDHARRDARVRRVDGSRGDRGEARRVGLRESAGDFVTFLDGDHTWSRRFLELSLGALERAPEAVASHAAVRRRNDEGEIEYQGGKVQLAELEFANPVDLTVLLARSAPLRQIAGHADRESWSDRELVSHLVKAGELEYLPFIGADEDVSTAGPHVSPDESARWRSIMERPHLSDASPERDAPRPRVPDRTSLVVVIDGSIGHAARSVDRALHTFTGDLDIVLVDTDSSAAVGRRLLLRYIGESRVQYLRLPTSTGFASAANYGFWHATGARVAFLDSDSDPRDGWLDELCQELRNTGARAAQALIVNADYTVRHAGYAFYEGGPLPSALLTGLTIDDALAADTDDLTAVSAVGGLFDADFFAKLSGFDPLYADGMEDVDLCLRGRRDIPHVRFACVPRALVVREPSAAGSQKPRRVGSRRLAERWGDQSHRDDRRRYLSISMTVTGFASVLDGRHPTAIPVVARAVDAHRDLTAASLRWAIKTGAPCTRGGDHWGDVAFADDLARALRGRGHDAVVDRYEAWDRATSYLDDVVLTLRGRHPIPPQPGALNILWVISRPDLVTVEEVRSYDLVFAASQKWSRWMTERSGRTVEPLLQATAPERFHADVVPVDRPDDIIFVGGSHGHEFGRAIVGLALEADAPVGLWGPGWGKLAPPHAVRDGYLDFDDLPRAYRAANIVLNDHYPDMAGWAFINNRMFDAVACGTPVISDAIEGLELFEGAVETADSVERMRELVNDRSWIPSSENMARIASRIRTEHSFDARAGHLIAAVRSARATPV